MVQKIPNPSAMSGLWMNTGCANMDESLSSHCKLVGRWTVKRQFHCDVVRCFSRSWYGIILIYVHRELLTSAWNIKEGLRRHETWDEFWRRSEIWAHICSCWVRNILDTKPNIEVFFRPESFSMKTMVILKMEYKLTS